MPFLSKDWRSPGEEWIRYEGGWEKRKTVILVPRSDIDSENKVSYQFLIKLKCSPIKTFKCLYSIYRLF